MDKTWILDAEWSTDGSNKVWIVVVRSLNKPDWVLRFHSDGEFRTWLYASNPDCLIGHNIIDADKRILEQRWRVNFTGIEFIDTLVLSRLDDPERKGGHSLANWGSIVGIPKGDFTDYNNPCEEMYQYCETDTLITVHAYNQLKGVGTTQWSKGGNSFSSSWIEHNLQHCLTTTRERGFLLDQSKVHDLLGELEVEKEVIESKLEDSFPEKVEYVQLKTKVKTVRTPFNPGSRQQIAERLIPLGWTTDVKSPTGRMVVDETTLAGWDIPEVKLILRYLLLQKRIAMLEGWLDKVEPDGRVRCYIIGTGAITHRASHSSPNLGQVVGVQSEYGAEFRACWTVPEGYSLVGVDLSGIEGRMAGHYTKDMDYANELMEGDIHSKNMKLWGLTSRPIAKNVYYALMYGAGADKIAKMMGCSVKEAKKRIAAFYDSLPLLKALKERVERMSNGGYLPGLDGRRVAVRNTYSAINTLFQSGAAIVAKLWYILTVEGIKAAKLDATVVIWVHDELQIEVKEGQEDHVKQIALEAAEKAGELLNVRLPIKAAGKIGKNWFETH